MYVANSLASLNFYPHTVHFETVRDADNARRHNWSPGYYEDADAPLDHHVGSPDVAAPLSAALPEASRDTTANAARDDDLSAVPA